VSLVARTRRHSSSKSIPAALAAIGTRLWSVMPGTVLTSSSFGLAVRVEHEVHPAPARGTDGVEGALAELLQLALALRRQAAGAVIAGGVGVKYLAS
jgi:hypothetical protein